MEHDLNGKNMDDEEQKKLKNDPLTYMCWLLLYFMKQKITTEFFRTNKKLTNYLLQLHITFFVKLADYM